MTQVRSSIPNFLGGLSTLPPVLRERTEVAEADNVLFSLADGAYRRPGTELIHRFLTRPTEWFLDPGEELPDPYPFSDETKAQLERGGIAPEDYVGRLIRGQRAIWAFPVSASRVQVLLVGHGTWETLWLDLETNDLLRDGDGNPIDSLGRPIGAPTLFGRSDYLKIRNARGEPLRWPEVLDEKRGVRPQRTFRATKSESRIWILNKTVPVRLTDTRADQNAHNLEFRSGYHFNHWMLIFYALTSGRDVRVAMTFEFEEEDKTLTKYGQEFNLGDEDGIETVAENFKKQWERNLSNSGAQLLPNAYRTKPPNDVRDLFVVEAKRQTAAVRALGLKIKKLKFYFQNVAARAVSDDAKKEDGTPDLALSGLPTPESLPATAPRDWILEVQGSSSSELDNAWYRFKVPEDEEGA